jgi:hypothetical protein
MLEEYPWYNIVDGKENLMQGDFIYECPVIIPTSEISDEVEANVISYNVIVMSQSCDLVQKKVDLVLVCSIWSLSDFEQKSGFFKSKEGKESLRQGNVLGYHLMNKCTIEGFQTDYLVVDFRNVYGVPFNFLLGFVNKRGKRLRLLPPYREHLAQAFARFFMRVGLPVDIPPFK